MRDDGLGTREREVEKLRGESVQCYSVYGVSDIHLALASGNNSVARNDLRHNTASSLNTKGKGVDIDKDDVAKRLVAGRDTTLDVSTMRDGLVGVDTLGGLLAKVLLQELLYLRDTRPLPRRVLEMG